MAIEYKTRHTPIVAEVTDVLRLAHLHPRCLQTSIAEVSPGVSLLLVAGDTQLVSRLHSEALALQKTKERLATEQDGHA